MKQSVESIKKISRDVQAFEMSDAVKEYHDISAEIQNLNIPSANNSFYNQTPKS